MFRFLLETFLLGLKNLRLHKLRSLLTALGIIFGVTAVIIMVAIGEGAKREALEQIYAGQYDQARATLSAGAAAFAAPAMAPAASLLSAEMAELQGLAEQAPAGFDSVTRKSVLYGSRVASRSRKDYGKRS